MSVYDAANENKRKIILEKLALLDYPKKYDPPYTEIPFGEICGVWADFGMHELQAKGGSLLDPLSPKAREKLREKLLKQLSDRTALTLADLLHSAQKQNRLAGSTPKERYLYFIEKILPQPKFLQAFFSHFPPLARFISEQILLWIDQAIEFLSRFQKEEFASRKIENISFFLSDLYNGNRFVYQITFENEESLIYRPKSVGLDKAFNGFLEKLNHLGLEPKLKTYKILDRDEYGWVDFIKTLPCERDGEVKRYFERFGMLICIMYMLEGIDCHSENVICSGEDPVLIDLESLFHPILKGRKQPTELAAWNHSVLRTGFLPSFGLGLERKIDFSPLGAEELKKPQIVADWQNVNTDQMQFVFLKKIVNLDIPRPKIHGKIASTTDYIDPLLLGFKKMYQLFSSQKKNMISYLDPLFHYPVRCLFRSTSLYHRILEKLTDPKLMRFNEAVDKTLEILAHFSPIKENPDSRLIVDKEKEALLYGDTPYFFSSPSDCHLYLGKNILAKNCLESPAKQRVIDKIARLDEKDLLRQMEYMDLSLYYLRALDSGDTCRYKPFDPKEEVQLLTEEELLLSADRIGQKVLSLSQTLSDQSPAWIALEWDPEFDRYIFQPLSPSLYSGTAGIALFFAALGKILKKPIYIEQAERILEREIKPYYDDPASLLLVSNTAGMAGLGGIVYGFSAIGQILGKEKYLKEASYIASLIDKKKIEKDSYFDLVSGSAGFLLALLSHYEKTKEPFLLEKAEETGRFLIGKARKMDRGIGWPTKDLRCLCGMSHGAAGISYALFKLAKASQYATFAEAAEQGCLYERSQYSSKKENWPDLRKDHDKGNPFSWCRGAPGIGLARMHAFRLYPDQEKEKEIEIAMAATQKHLNGDLDHLCYGNFGRIAILWEAADILGRKEFEEIALKETALLLKRFHEKGTFRLFYKLPEEIQSPSFMHGLAGIGYTLLRFTAGKNLPDPLILE